MNSYFATHGKKFRGRPLTTLPVVLNKDLSRLQENTLQLTTREDLEHLRCIAQNRQQWRELSTRIRKAAEAPPSDDWDAEGPKSSKSVEKGMQLECNSHYFFNTKLQNMQYWCHFPIKFHFQIFLWGILLTIFVVVWVLSVVQGSWVLGLSTARRFLLYFSFYFYHFLWLHFLPSVKQLSEVLSILPPKKA